jgi:glycosyltransferase involved in cell wall biosynthesis
MNILMSSFNCSPYKGSENSLGWNWIYTAAKEGNTISVLTWSINKEEIEKYWDLCSEEESKIRERIKYYYIEPKENKLKISNHINEILVYRSFQKKAYKFAKKLILKEKFDFVHHVTWASCVQITHLYKLGVPFILGPVGGGERIPNNINISLSFKDKLTEWLRVLVQNISKSNYSHRQLYSKSSKIFVTTKETKMIIPKKYWNKVYILQAIGLKVSDIVKQPKKYGKINCLKVLAVGRLIYWKGIEIAIDAVIKAYESGLNIELTIVGEGEKKDELMKKVNDKHKSVVKFLGSIEYSRLNDIYNDSDLLLNCSLHDSGCLVVVEALSQGLPVICIKTGGPAILTDDNCAIRIEPDSYENVGNNVAKELKNLANEPEKLSKMSYWALRKAQELVYENKYKEFIKELEKVL